MEIHKFQIVHKSKKDEFVLFPIGDIHAGDPNFKQETFEKTMRWIESHPNAYMIGMGDYFNNTPTNHDFFDITNVDRELLTMEEQFFYIEKQFKKMAEMGRIIGLHEGNHDNRIVPNTGYNWVAILCKNLGVKYLGHTALTRLSFHRIHEINSWDIFSTHGYFRGATPSGKLTKLLKLISSFNADIFLHGDVHETMIYEYPVKMLNFRGNLETKSVVFCLTGSFLETYKEGTKGYGEVRNYQSMKTGCPKITIYPHHRIIKASIYGTEDWKEWK